MLIWHACEYDANCTDLIAFDCSGEWFFNFQFEYMYMRNLQLTYGLANHCFFFENYSTFRFQALCYKGWTSWIIIGDGFGYGNELIFDRTQMAVYIS